MGKAKAKPAFPTVRVTIREGAPSPSQAQSWRRLWALLFTPDDEVPPAATGGGGDGERGEADGQSAPLSE